MAVITADRDKQAITESADGRPLIVPGGVCAAKGFAVAGVRCGIKRKRRDVALLLCTTGAEVACAGVFTTNVVRAPCVTRNERLLRAVPFARAIVVNAGNANAGNGTRGEEDNETMARLAADALGVGAEHVLTASTGIIGTPLPMNLLTDGIAMAAREMASDAEAGAHAAEAILTTDTFAKEFAVAFRCEDGLTAHVGGIAKGSGMIAPNMATMLAFLTTDLAVAPPLLDKALRQAVHVSFNCLTVDGDTSTNDSCIVLASGAAGNAEIQDDGDPDLARFVRALTEVCVHLAREVARDGEGATKLVTVRVTGAKQEADARKVARTIAESPLVKTALFGNDPNWGRLLMAAGRAGVAFDPNQATAWLAGTCIFTNGQPTPFDAKALSAAMAVKELEIVVDLAMGEQSAAFYTCDLSYDYVRINAEYHT